jgi:hypothetical protein
MVVDVADFEAVELAFQRNVSRIGVDFSSRPCGRDWREDGVHRSVAGQNGSQTDLPYSASKAAKINFAQSCRTVSESMS